MGANFGPTHDCEIYRSRMFVEQLPIPPDHGARIFTLYDADWDQAIILYDEDTMEEVWRTGSGKGEIEARILHNDSDEERRYLITGWHLQPGAHWDQSRRRTHFNLPNCGFLVVGFEDGRDQDFKDGILVCHVTDGE